MKKLIPTADNRPGYIRQQAEPVTITCECGAQVLEGRGGLVHIGECTKTSEGKS